MPNTTRCSFCNTIYSDFIDYSSGCPDNNGAPHAWHSTTNPSPSLPPDFPSDADMSRLLSEQDAADITSLSSNLSAEKTDRFNQSMAEMVADASGKRGIDREEFITQYKKLINHATRQAIGMGDFPDGSFKVPAPVKIPSPPSPHVIYETSDGSIFQCNIDTIFQNSLRACFSPSNRSFSITTISGTEHYPRQVFEGFLLYAHDTILWIDQLASQGVVMSTPFGGGSIPAPATGNGLRSILAFPSMRTILEELLAARESKSE